ncbi:MAG: acyl-CoA dehydratase activase [Thermacetogeniaceae bacterium]|jgi:predicted CoA-substrate-specific enzyme activase|nr:acyl-CoA dehydratase activase [Thermoanaerobacterales bacterium]
MLTAGIDIGSMSTKAVIFNGQSYYKAIAPTGWSPRQAAEQVFNDLLKQSEHIPDQIDFIVATGYGRVSIDFADRVVTEITCHARGAAYLVPGTDLVIDIGGQDSKVIRINEQGQVLDFAMNDKCAAGTGRFLQVIAAALGVDVSELASLSAGKSPLTLNSMCTVFAESEVISLISQGKEKGEIIAGLHQSIARRIASMVQRMGAINRITFTGGVARNEGVRESLEQQLGVPVLVPEDCQMAGAIGAALIAQDYSRK